MMTMMLKVLLLVSAFIALHYIAVPCVVRCRYCRKDNEETKDIVGCAEFIMRAVEKVQVTVMLCRAFDVLDPDDNDVVVDAQIVLIS